MIRQICPHCFAPVEFADEAAGTTADCPACRKPVPVPGAYAPSVAASAKPTPPPGFVPPTEVPRPTVAGAVADALTPDGPGRTLVLAPAPLEWVPVVCFTLILVLTFFTWVGLYPGGFRAYGQSAWAATVGNFESNPFSEEQLQLQRPLEKLVGGNWLLLPYLIALLAAVALGWADRLVKVTNVTGLPGPLSFVEKLWPHRFTVIAGLAVLTLVLLATQVRVGFGLDTATRQLVAERYAETVQAAEAATASAKQKVLVKQGMELGQYDLQNTVWLTLAVTLHVTAVVAAGLRLWLYRRGTKPLPRVTFTA